MHACSAPKKVASSVTETAAISEKQTEQSSNEIYAFVDTTQKENLEITYVKLEFYPPAGPAEQEAPPAAGPYFYPDFYAGNIAEKPPATGAIKSIERYTVKAKREQSGVSESAESTSVNRMEEKTEHISREAEVSEQPAADPYRWRYIFWIIVLVIAVAAYVTLRKTGIVGVVASFFASIFKKS